MAIINYKGDIERNLQEQVAENKRLILQHYNTTRTLELFDVRVIGVLDEWEEPTGQTFEYGDAYFVGTEAPYSLYIFTRADSVHPNDYWLAIEDLIVQGPQGKPLTFEELTEAQKEQLRGEPGVSPKWFVVDRVMGVSGPKEGDMMLQGSTGNVYQYEGGNFVLKTNIKGKDGRGIYWVRINANGELLVEFDNGTQTNLGKVVGSPGRDGTPGRDGITTVVNIIGELPADSIISATYDPATVEPNSAVIMPVDGTNHIFIVVDGIWSDAGPFSGGSSVYADGQFQTSFNADTKVDKKTLPTTISSQQRGAVYGLAVNGTATLYKVGRADTWSQSRDGGGIAVYDNSCYLYSRSPALSETSTTKVATVGYVKSAIQSAHSNTEVFHTGVFGAKTEDTATLPLYTIPIGPLSNTSHIQLKCDVMAYSQYGYQNIPVPTFIDISTSSPDTYDQVSFGWMVMDSVSNSVLIQGTGTATITDGYLENALFKVDDDQYYNEIYLTIHCPHNTDWYFPG